MTVFFFEGLNSLGKSTLIRAFPEDNVIKELLDDRQELKLVGEARIKAIWMSSCDLYHKYADLKCPVLINRSFLSETVYSKALYRKYSFVDMQYLDHLWSKRGAKIIYLKRDFPIEIVLQRRPQFEKEFVLKIEKLYEKYLKKISLDIITILVKPEHSLQTLDLLKKIIK